MAVFNIEKLRDLKTWRQFFTAGHSPNEKSELAAVLEFSKLDRSNNFDDFQLQSTIAESSANSKPEDGLGEWGQVAHLKWNEVTESATYYQDHVAQAYQLIPKK
jgi:hypothetical protein